MDNPINIVRRGSYRGGLIGFFMGASHMATLERGIRGLNSDGYRVVLLENDSWGALGWLFSKILLIITLGLFTVEPGFLIVGEVAVPSPPRIDQPAVPSSPRIQLRD